MAQAAVDLPDPKQRPGSSSPTTASATASPNVDDLLAQLAGEEIDRLLAEAETGRTPSFDEIPTAEVPYATTPVRVTQPPIRPAGGADLVDAAMSAQLDELFNQLESQKPPEVVSESIAPAATLLAPEERAALAEPATPADEIQSFVAQTEGEPASSVAAPGAASILELADHEMAAQERVALELDLPPEPDPSDRGSERPTFLVRCLEVLNAPLMAAPELLREVVGKIALLTLFNAVAVLVYVLIIRKHPH